MKTNYTKQNRNITTKLKMTFTGIEQNLKNTTKSKRL